MKRSVAVSEAKAKTTITNENLLSDLRRYASEIGHTPGANAFDKWFGSCRSQLFIIRFGSWRAACALAGLEPNTKPDGFGVRMFSAADFAQAYRRIRAVIGSPPSYTKWDIAKVDGEPSAVTIRHRYNNKWMVFVEEMERGIQR